MDTQKRMIKIVAVSSLMDSGSLSLAFDAMSLTKAILEMVSNRAVMHWIAIDSVIVSMRSSFSRFTKK